MKENQLKAKRWLSKLSIPVLILLIFTSTFSHANTLAQGKRFYPQDNRIPGGIAVIPLVDSSQSTQVMFNGNKVWQLTDKDNKKWAVIGIPLKQKVGNVDYQVDGENFSFTIHDKAYKEQYLTVKRKHSNPSEDQIKRIQKESRLSKKAFTTFSDINKNQSFKHFLRPAEGPTSSPFGLKRFFNEQPRRPHSGIDIAAPRGSDIIAPADGEIILTGNFFFNGNSIFIDHGQGLITMYCHMDQLESNTGDIVKAGDIIGKVGSTGRATGPHLHWTVSLNNSRIEPLLFLAEPAE